MVCGPGSWGDQPTAAMGTRGTGVVSTQPSPWDSPCPGQCELLSKIQGNFEGLGGSVVKTSPGRRVVWVHRPPVWVLPNSSDA